MSASIEFRQREKGRARRAKYGARDVEAYYPKGDVPVEVAPGLRQRAAG
jgi:hypothetical protein